MDVSSLLDGHRKKEDHTTSSGRSFVRFCSENHKDIALLEGPSDKITLQDKTVHSTDFRSVYTKVLRQHTFAEHKVQTFRFKFKQLRAFTRHMLSTHDPVKQA